MARLRAYDLGENLPLHGAATRKEPAQQLFGIPRSVETHQREYVAELVRGISVQGSRCLALAHLIEVARECVIERLYRQ